MDEVNLNGCGDATSHKANGLATCHSHSKDEEESASPPPSPAAPKVPAVKDMNITVATQYGRIDRVAELIAAGGVDINQPDAEGCYLMHWAAINNRVDLIK